MEGGDPMIMGSYLRRPAGNPPIPVIEIHQEEGSRSDEQEEQQSSSGSFNRNPVPEGGGNILIIQNNLNRSLEGSS